MWLAMWVVGCRWEAYPQAFDWKIDRTKVVAVSVWPVDADATVPRRVDALVLSPHRVESVRAEICGRSDDQPVAIRGGACFSEPGLVDPIPGEVPLEWTPEPLTFECTGAVIGGYTYSDSSYTDHGYETVDTSVDTGLDSGLSYEPPPTCGSSFPLRIVARTEKDETSSMTEVVLYTDPYDPREFGVSADPTQATPKLEVVDGEAVAGGRVLLRFSAESQFSGQYAWYAEDGVYWGTGRTAEAGFDRRGGRTWAQNWLEIPDDWHGELEVAAVVQSRPPLWATAMLEVP